VHLSSPFERRVARAGSVLAQRNADALILLNPEDGQYFTLDEVGARVWELCDGTQRVADLIATIHAEYDAPLETIQADILELLDDLAREKLVAHS
jgi:Coenzyme PQQ synthesis protein D (PqqD)